MYFNAWKEFHAIFSLSISLHFEWLQWRRRIYSCDLFSFTLYTKVKQQIVERLECLLTLGLSLNAHCVVYFKIILSNCLHIISAFEFMTNNWVIHTNVVSRSNTKTTHQKKGRQQLKDINSMWRTYKMRRIWFLLLLVWLGIVLPLIDHNTDYSLKTNTFFLHKLFWFFFGAFCLKFIVLING